MSNAAPPTVDRARPAVDRARRMAAAVGLRVGAITALGLLFVVPSELWFYPVRLDAGLAVMTLAYGLCGWLAVATLRVAGRDNAAAWWLAAALFGCLVEGVVVAQLYEVPGFSLVWTPLAWHAVVTVHASFLWLRRSRRPLLPATLLGFAVGVWGAWYWNLADLPEGAAPEAWQAVAPFAWQVAVGGGLLLAGHRLWDRIEPRLDAIDPRLDVTLLGGLAALVWGTGHAAAFFPASLTLPLVAALTAFSLRRPHGGPPVERRRVPTVALLAIPAAAIAACALATHAQWVWPANVAAVLVGGSIGTWCWVRALFGRPAPPADA